MKITAGSAFILGASIALSCAAQDIKKYPTISAKLRQSLFQPQYLSIAQSLGEKSLEQKPLLRHLYCDSAVCETTVLVNLRAHTPSNNCGIRATDIIYITQNVQMIKWNLVDDGKSGFKYQFLGGNVASNATGIVIDDPTFKVIEEVPRKPPRMRPTDDVFLNPSQTATSHQVVVTPAGPAFDKTFKFAIQLEFQLPSDGSVFTPCDPLDPLIVNHSD